MTETICDRQRAEGFYPRGPATWRDDGTCSYCGSMRPERFFECVAAGAEITPTDKDYKAYVALPSPQSGREGKFYFYHLDDAGMRRFVELLNAGGMKLAFPGHFYVPPFFVRFGPKAD